MKSQIAVITAHTDDERPSYFLQEAFESLLKQDYQSWHWYLSGNGLVPEEIENHPQVTLVKTDSRHPSSINRNLALTRVKEPYLTCLDNDDFLTNNSLSSRIKPLLDNEHLDWVLGSSLEYKEHRYISHMPLPFTEQHSNQEISPLYLYDWWKKNAHVVVPFLPNAILTKTNLVKKIGGWTGLPQMEDLNLFGTLLNSYTGFVIKPEVYYYRKHKLQTIERPDFSNLEPYLWLLFHEQAGKRG